MRLLVLPWKWLRGVGVPAWIVATLRGALEAAVLAGILVLLAGVTDADLGEGQWIAPLLLNGLRILEGLADNIDPAKKRVSDS